MAPMKHAARQKQKPAPMDDLKRDRAFRELLAKEYGVEDTPRKFHRAFEKTLAELPDELPVRPRPVYYIFRQVATVAAVLAITFAALLGVNTTYPQLTEALPGLGPIFVAINGGETQKELPAPEETPAPQEEKKEFQPVVLESRGSYPGSLEIEDAWCDGKALVLSLRLELAGEAADTMKWADDMKWDVSEENPSAAANYYLLRAGSVEWIPDGSGAEIPWATEDYLIKMHAGTDTMADIGRLSDFKPTGDGYATATWRLEMDNTEQTAAQDEVEVSISLPSLSVVENYNGAMPFMGWDCGFTSTFTVPVDRSRNRKLRDPAQDNGATLLSVDYSPSQVDIEMELPAIGYLGDMLVAIGDDYEDPSQVLGIYPTLTAPSSSAGSGAKSTLTDYYLSAGDEGQGPTSYRMQYVFSNDQFTDFPSSLVLTVREVPEKFSRVVAEFTIDLDTGRAFASENYLSEGLEQADTSRDPRYPRALGCFENGFLCRQAEFWQKDSAQVVLVAQDLKPGRTLQLNGYCEDGGFRCMSVLTGEEEQNYEVGAYWETPYQAPSSGEEYTLLVFNLYPWATDEEGHTVWATFERLELVDVDTGEVLFEDLVAAYEQSMEEIVGGCPQHKPETESNPAVEEDRETDDRSDGDAVATGLGE